MVRQIGGGATEDGATSAGQRIADWLCQVPVRNPASAAELAAALSVMSLAELAENKLAYLLLSLADQWAVPLTGAHCEELARLRLREALMDGELALVAETLAECPVDYLMLRGRAIGRFYPPGWPRQYNDIDILLSDERALSAVLGRLARLGYYVARPIVSRAAGRRIWLGIALNKTVDGLGHPMYLDLCTLGPALSSTRHLAMPQAGWRSRETIMARGTAVPVAEAHWQAALLGVELAERGGSFAARDVLDLAMLDRAGIDWHVVRSYLRAAPGAAAAVGAVARLLKPSDRARNSAGPLAVSWPAARRTTDPRAMAAAWTRALIQLARRGDPVLARRIAEWAPSRLWFACGLPVYLLPPWQQGLRGGVGRQLAGLPGYRGRIYPLVPPGYTQAVFAGNRTPLASQ